MKPQFVVEPHDSGFYARVVSDNMDCYAVSELGEVDFSGTWPPAEFKTFRDAKNVLGIMKRDMEIDVEG